MRASLNELTRISPHQDSADENVEASLEPSDSEGESDSDANSIGEPSSKRAKIGSSGTAKSAGGSRVQKKWRKMVRSTKQQAEAVGDEDDALTDEDGSAEGEESDADISASEAASSHNGDEAGSQSSAGDVIAEMVEEERRPCGHASDEEGIYT